METLLLNKAGKITNTAPNICNTPASKVQSNWLLSFSRRYGWTTRACDTQIGAIHTNSFMIPIHFPYPCLPLDTVDYDKLWTWRSNIIIFWFTFNSCTPHAHQFHLGIDCVLDRDQIFHQQTLWWYCVLNCSDGAMFRIRFNITRVCSQNGRKTALSSKRIIWFLELVSSRLNQRHKFCSLHILVCRK